jgi:Mrp family chromosome partitioning ATPase
VRQETAAAQRSVDQELDRIANAATTALERTKATEQALEAQLQELKGRVLAESRALVELRELERIAEATRSVYQTFLVRVRELDEQQRIDPNAVTVLAAAEPARTANGPGVLALIGAASAAGLGLGAARALRRDRRDPRVRSALQLGELAGEERVHLLPLPTRGSLARLLPRQGTRERLAHAIAGPAGGPTAIAAERLFRTLAAAQPRRAPLVCVVTAAETMQGKSSVALNLALAAARAGENVLIIDADREDRTATRSAGADDRPGLAEVINATAPCGAVVIKPTDGHVDLLPAGNLADLRPTRARLDRIGEALLGPLAGYDVIVVDGSIIGRDRLTLALAAQADATIVAVARGMASKLAVAEALGWIRGTGGTPPRLVLVEA